jgi:hypothetical protein
MKKACTRAWLLLAFPVIALSACEKAQQLHRFGEISVSNPNVIEKSLYISIKNDTGHTLCYFEDSLFYGSGVVEGNSDIFGLSESPLPSSLRDLQFFNGRNGGRIRELKVGEGEISIALSGKEPSSGDDVMFSIFYCKESAQGEHRTFVYTGRV